MWSIKCNRVKGKIFLPYFDLAFFLLRFFVAKVNKQSLELVLKFGYLKLGKSNEKIAPQSIYDLEVT